MMEKCIYLDNAATTFPKPEAVYQAMDEVNRLYAVNAGRGSYALASHAAAVIAETRTLLKQISGANETMKVVLMPSATIACNQLLWGIDWKSEDTVYVSPFEHNAVMRVLALQQEKYHFSIEELALDEESLLLDLKKIQFQFLRKKPSVVVMSHVSNVTGYILPVEQVAALAKEYGALMVVDGAQGLGLVPVCLRETDIDAYVFAGHKTLYGPFGTGGFLIRESICEAGRVKPVLAGGTGSDSLNLKMPQTGELAFEPGSPNIVAIAGLRAALQELCSRKNESLFTQERRLTEYLIEKLSNIPEVKLYLPADKERHVGIVSFSMEGYQASDVGMILDQDYRIAVRTGYQCAPLIHKYLRDESSGGVVRVGIGRYTTMEELDALVDAVRDMI